MEKEKVLIKSTDTWAKKFNKIMSMVFCLVFFLFCAYWVYEYVSSDWYDSWQEFIDVYGTTIYVPLFSFLGIWLTIWILIGALCNNRITVSDKRVWGVLAITRTRIDLPIDSITSIKADLVFRGIKLGTSSGNINFYFVKEYAEIYNIVNSLLIKRQEERKQASAVVVQKQETPLSNAEELKKFKDLLDSGVISQEEFDAKKQQLLGI